MKLIGLTGVGFLVMLTLVTQPREARQLVLVKTGGWEAVEGVLQRYQRRGPGWSAVGEAIPVVVGRNGMAWGRGLHDTHPGPGPVKKEGDGKSPAGIFPLSSAFGYASPNEATEVKLPFIQARPTTECVDDAKSVNYNRILDRLQISIPDWSSAEQMRRPDELYRWGVVVDHNVAPTQAGAGSCIFLHIWEGPAAGTAGCTAMEAAQMERLISWLEPAAHPILVQLPVAEYTRLRGPWGLP
jgi:zinc D-Ala-D-Ala dipeptidase